MDLLAVAQTDSHTLNHTKSLARGSSRFQYTLHTETKSDQWAGRPHYAWMAPSRAFHRAGARVRDASSLSTATRHQAGIFAGVEHLCEARRARECLIDVLCVLTGTAFQQTLHKEHTAHNAHANITLTGIDIRAPEDSEHQHAGD